MPPLAWDIILLLQATPLPSPPDLRFLAPAYTHTIAERGKTYEKKYKLEASVHQTDLGKRERLSQKASAVQLQRRRTI